MLFMEYSIRQIGNAPKASVAFATPAPCYTEGTMKKALLGAMALALVALNVTAYADVGKQHDQHTLAAKKEVKQIELSSADGVIEKMVIHEASTKIDNGNSILLASILDNKPGVGLMGNRYGIGVATASSRGSTSWYHQYAFNSLGMTAGGSHLGALGQQQQQALKPAMASAKESGSYMRQYLAGVKADSTLRLCFGAKLHKPETFAIIIQQGKGGRKCAEYVFLS